MSGGVVFGEGHSLRPPRAVAIIAAPPVEPTADPIDRLVMSSDGDAALGGEGEQRQRTADSVRHTEVSVPARPLRSRTSRPVGSPPAWQAVVARQRKANDVSEHVTEKAAAVVSTEQVGAQAGETGDEVILALLWQGPGVHSLVRPGQPVAHDRVDLGVEHR